jgi:hypothetical protein
VLLATLLVLLAALLVLLAALLLDFEVEVEVELEAFDELDEFVPPSLGLSSLLQPARATKMSEREARRSVMVLLSLL